MSIARMRVEEEERRLRHPLAFPSSRSRGRRVPEPDDEIRTCYERDGHRILHAKPFRRLRNKTQVFFSPENDHIATRMDHSLYVATISRTVCRALGLNDDLAFAMALGHDLGHSPFGHSGERVIAQLLDRHRDPGQPRVRYWHEAQSLRVVDLLAVAPGHPFSGLNLTYEVRDGIRCHCGESTEQAIRPRPADEDADPASFEEHHTLPITMEGCVVRMADRIAYLGRDYEDAQTALQEQLPPLPRAISGALGVDNRQIINVLVTDVIRQNQIHPDAVGFSEEIFAALIELRSFNYRNIYYHPKLEAYREKIDAILERIFEVLLAHLERQPPAEWGRIPDAGPEYLRSLARFVGSAGYASPPSPPRVIADYMSLMTDGFAFKVFKEIALPDAVV